MTAPAWRGAIRAGQSRFREERMRAIAVEGLNPITVTFTPKDPNAQPPDAIEVVKRWEIMKLPGSVECLDVSVFPDPNSLATVSYTETLREPDGSTRPVGVQTAVPQRFKITLGCGTCRCGQPFGVMITARVEEARQRGTLNDMTTISRSLVINCAPPGCPSTILLGAVTPALRGEFGSFLEITPDLVARLNATIGPPVDAT
jgi:hypothetical protein